MSEDKKKIGQEENELFQKAMVDRDPDAMVRYAKFLWDNAGSQTYSPAGRVEVKSLYKMAAQQGHPEAMLMASFDAESIEERHNLLLRSAQGGVRRAQLSVGENYIKGNGVEYNLQEALLWWKKALASPEKIDNGNEHHQLIMGISEELGRFLKEQVTSAPRTTAVNDHIRQDIKDVADALLSSFDIYDQRYGQEYSAQHIDRLALVTGYSHILDLKLSGSSPKPQPPINDDSPEI